MLHHVDVHVRDLAAAKELFDALADSIGYRRRSADDEFIGYEPVDGGRPRFGLLRDENAGGSMRLAFAVGRRCRCGFRPRARRHGDRGARAPPRIRGRLLRRLL